MKKRLVKETNLIGDIVFRIYVDGKHIASEVDPDKAIKAYENLSCEPKIQVLREDNFGPEEKPMGIFKEMDDIVKTMNNISIFPKPEAL